MTKALLTLALVGFPELIWAQTVSPIDPVFERWRHDTPGCAVGVSQGGKTVLEKAYGMANLEHAVPITPATIFHAASLAKQVTAMAVMLLARDGKGCAITSRS
jgi:CubicO group peptidase (beta-lactamase class C family)